MMALRAIFIILAAVTYRYSIVLAVALLVGGAVLPWCAVLIANNRPPKRRNSKLGSVSLPPNRSLPSGHDDRTVDS